MLSWVGSRCWTRMQAMPLPAGSAPTSFLKAPRPPAEAPIATTGKSAGWSGSLARRLDRRPALRSSCKPLSGILNCFSVHQRHRTDVIMLGASLLGIDPDQSKH